MSDTMNWAQSGTYAGLGSAFYGHRSVTVSRVVRSMDAKLEQDQVILYTDYTQSDMNCVSFCHPIRDPAVVKSPNLWAMHHLILWSASNKIVSLDGHGNVMHPLPFVELECTSDKR